MRPQILNQNTEQRSPLTVKVRSVESESTIFYYHVFNVKEGNMYLLVILKILFIPTLKYFFKWDKYCEMLYLWLAQNYKPIGGLQLLCMHKCCNCNCSNGAHRLRQHAAPLGLNLCVGKLLVRNGASELDTQYMQAGIISERRRRRNATERQAGTAQQRYIQHDRPTSIVLQQSRR